MAGGWTRDGAVQDQIDASIDDAVQEARSRLPQGESLTHCEECETAIPEARRQAVPGVRLCVSCHSERDQEQAVSTGINRRARKDSQLRGFSSHQYLNCPPQATRLFREISTDRYELNGQSYPI